MAKITTQVIPPYSLKCIECGAPVGEMHRFGCSVGGDDTYRSGQTSADKPPLQIIVTLPPEVEPYAADIQRFLDAMVFKLGKNAHKGRWEGFTHATNLPLLKQEVVELEEAVRRGNMVEIMLEAADVANFALIQHAIAVEKK